LRTQRYYNERMARDDYRSIPKQTKKVEAAIKSRKPAQLFEAIDSAMLALEMLETDMMIGIATDNKASKNLRKLVKSAQALAMKAVASPPASPSSPRRAGPPRRPGRRRTRG
jgi:hypothetical protein